MNTGRIIVCGGRNYADAYRVNHVLDGLLTHEAIQRVFFPYEQMPQTVSWELRTLVDGAASGADSLAFQWAIARGVETERHPADWSRGRSAGPLRNEEMARSGADLLVAFPGGTGTDNMITHARFFRIPVMKVAA